MAHSAPRLLGCPGTPVIANGAAPANRTRTPQVARRLLDVHQELAALIEMHDAAGARKLMDDHVKMIRARRVAEHGENQYGHFGCC